MDNFLTTIIVAIISSGVLNTIIAYYINKMQKKREEDSDVKKATRLLMKYRLKVMCQKYIKQQWIYEDELEDLIAMHRCYHEDLQGNGFLDKQMDRVMKLEIRGAGDICE